MTFIKAVGSCTGAVRVTSGMSGLSSTNSLTSFILSHNSSGESSRGNNVVVVVSCIVVVTLHAEPAHHQPHGAQPSPAHHQNHQPTTYVGIVNTKSS